MQILVSSGSETPKQNSFLNEGAARVGTAHFFPLKDVFHEGSKQQILIDPIYL